MTALRGAIYIRQSATRDQDVALSEPIQRSKGLALAERDGIAPDDVRVFIDLGRSGGAGKESRRRGYQDLLRAIERREIDVLYCLAITRLGRSFMELMRLAKLCNENGVAIVTDKEGRIDSTSPLGKLFLGIVALFAEFERDMAVQRQLDNVLQRALRGDKPAGPKPYGEREGNRVERVIEAYKETGTLIGTVRLLNAEGIPAPMGKLWSSSGLRIILGTSAPGLLPSRTVRGAKPASTGAFRFYQLLRCHCGRMMTGYSNKGKPAYRCHRASVVPGHGRPYIVSESMLLDAFQAELALVRVQARTYQSEAENVAAKVAALRARKAKLDDVYLDGETVSKDEYVRQSARIKDRIAELSVEGRARAIVVPDLDADVSAATTNAALRELFRYVELDRDLRPVRFEWTVREMRLTPLASSVSA